MGNKKIFDKFINGENAWMIADDLNKITFRGHDGSTADVEKVDCTKYGSGICKFNWGTSSGDFVYTNGMTFTIDFNLTDVYGNIVDLGTTTSSGILCITSKRFCKCT